MSETSGGEKSDQQITNQLASLVPSFDPAKDDMQTYKQKVEIVLGAWPKSRITELTTRLILNTQGSAFQTLQLHHAELMVNEEKSVTRLVELLGGQWGRIGLEQQYQDVENALYHTTQRADESHDSFLARADVLWSKAVSRKLSLSDLQAFVTLRGSLLSPEEKKRVILDADQSLEGKLTVPRVREAIRLLGATFFAAMTGQKTTARNKVYDATTMHVEHQDEVNVTDGMIATDDVGTEEDFIEALVMEGEDEDAVLVADFEALAADTIQEDSELAQAFNAYSDAHRRLSEKFRNRGFWPTSKGSSHVKGKGFGGKFNGQRGKGGYNPPRQRKSLQDRIMQSNCRACGRKGHWKAECPFKSTAPSTTSQASSTAPTSTVIIEQDVLPVEFLNLPQLPTEASCPIPEVCFATHGTMAILDSGASKTVVGDTPFLLSNTLLRALQAKVDCVGHVLESPLNRLQTPVQVEVEDLSHLSLEELSGETLAFGQKHHGKTFAEAWMDQEWVRFMVTRYSQSTKSAHRRFLRYVELKLDQHEQQQTGIPVIPTDSVPVEPLQHTAKAKTAAKAKAKGMASATPVYLPDMEGEWAMEPGPYPSTTMTSSSMPTEVCALQQRMLNMENAMIRIMHHLESQANAVQVPETTVSDQDDTSVFAALARRQRPNFVRSELVTPESRPEQEAKRSASDTTTEVKASEPEAPDNQMQTRLKDQSFRFRYRPDVSQAALELKCPVCPPTELQVDSGTELNSEEFAAFLQRFGSVMPEVMDQSDQSSTTETLTCVDVDWCLVANDHQDAAWRCEFDVPLSDHQGLPEDQEEAWSLLATNAKKQRSEVRLTELSPEEKEEFQKAKMAEVQSWVQTGTVSKVLRNQIPEDQILRCRWILTWKPLDNISEASGSMTQKPVKTHKAKVIASCGWQLQSFDVKAAFLQGQPQSDRVMAVDPVPAFLACMLTMGLVEVLEPYLQPARHVAQASSEAVQSEASKGIQSESQLAVEEKLSASGRRGGLRGWEVDLLSGRKDLSSQEWHGHGMIVEPLVVDVVIVAERQVKPLVVEAQVMLEARITAAQKMTATVGSVNEQLPRCDAAGRHEPEKNELPPPTLGGEGRSKLQGPPLIGQRLGRRASAQSSRQHPKHMCFQQPWG
ncbi:unnamed protein product [Cladocopium goreaui]|uniref:CCHC-type domain-containing protein n=1 Tax=Cladocopium goreaui TaxID=2562237 RepID=A0A9P1M406_9DINO|nr:unnamed protein product [Cladocopium goreaui]